MACLFDWISRVTDCNSFSGDTAWRKHVASITIQDRWFFWVLSDDGMLRRLNEVPKRPSSGMVECKSRLKCDWLILPNPAWWICCDASSWIACSVSAVCGGFSTCLLLEADNSCGSKHILNSMRKLQIHLVILHAKIGSIFMNVRIYAFYILMTNLVF